MDISTKPGLYQPYWCSAFFSLIFLLHLCSGLELELEGSQTSFAKFPGWHPCHNGSIIFDFRTLQGNAILMYTDDGLGRDFIEIKLIGGTVRLRMNLGAGTITMAAGSQLNDNKWHTVEIRRRMAHTLFILDKIPQSKEHKDEDLTFGQNMADIHSDVFIGGLPIGYTGRLQFLALPAVIFEPRFRGAIRGLKYSNCGKPKVEVEVIDYGGLRTSANDACAESNPCLNDAQCVSTDAAAFCDCTGTSYTGDFCETEISPPEATFYGNEYLSYSLASKADPIVSSKDQIFLRFKTRQANGLLFYTGASRDHIKIWLHEGGIHLSINLGSKPFDTALDSSTGGVRFDDNTWHTISIAREAREINIEVDRYTRKGTLFGDFTMLSSRVMYLGGAPPYTLLQGEPHASNFRGCLAEVWYKADNIRLDILVLAQTHNNFILVSGKPAFDICDDLAYSQPITFATEESAITLSGKTFKENSSIAFTFRTTEEHGLIMYSLGRRGTNDFFAIDLFEGEIYLILDTGSGPHSMKISADREANDGSPHKITIRYNGNRLGVSFDKIQRTHRNRDFAEPLDLEELYIGGGKLKKHVWLMQTLVRSTTFAQGYVGCIQDLIIDEEKIDLAQMSRSQGSEGVKNYCQAESLQCESHPCSHRGRCAEGWNRFICDCTATGFSGTVCNKVAVTLTFDGTQYMAISLAKEAATEVEEISLRFRTERTNGLLFVTSSNSTDDMLMLVLDGGQIRMDIVLRDHSQTVNLGEGLNDNKWHTVMVKRRQKRLLLQIDEGEPTKTKITHKPPVIMHTKDIRLGSQRVESRVTSAMDFDNTNLAKKANGEATQLSPSSLRGPENFVGKMQHFVYNGNNFIEMARSGALENFELDTNAEFSQNDEAVTYPITFRSPAAYLIIKYLIKRTYSLYFHMKTTQLNGLILYSGNGNGKDFMAVELSDGKIRYIFDVGNGPEVVESGLVKRINDNKWHTVAVIRSTLKQHILRVDENVQYFNNLDAAAVNLDTNLDFHIGGVSDQIFSYLPDKVHSRNGYQGCLASVDLDGDTRNLLHYSVDTGQQFQDDITEGCEGPDEECTPTSCDNNGICVQEWATFTCDCSMTSFSGPDCSQESIAYKFDGITGLITFSLEEDEWEDTKYDALALGVITEQRDAVLVRINSGGFDDYIEMELVDGNVYVVYNMGTMDHPIGQYFQKINDGEYHVIRFTRSGPNSTIQIDDGPVQTKNPLDLVKIWDPTITHSDNRGHQLMIFDRQAEVHVGGRKDRAGRIMRPFEGVIAGLVLNKKPILEYAKKEDARITISGDVSLYTSQLRPNYSTSTEASTTEYVLNVPSITETSTPGMINTAHEKTDDDDLVTGSGGCGSENQAGCVNEESTDKIVVSKVKTPKSTSTSSPSTSPRQSAYSGDEPCEIDDEECGDAGSGADTEFELKQNTTDFSFGPDNGSSQPHNVDVVDPPNMTETPAQKRPDKSTKQPYIVFDTTVESSSISSSKSTTKTATGPRGDTPETPLNTRSNPLKLNISLIVGIAIGVVLLLFILAYAIYKYRSRDEGTYKIDETKNYRYETVSTKAPTQANGSNGVAAKSHSNCSKSAKKKGTVKEWYV